MFVATSNSFNIPPALLDRMEVIRLSGYTEDEKLNIAKRYLLPKQVKNNGLKENEINIAESAIRDIIRYYTREAGVRSLDREISKICRKVVKMLLLKGGEKKIAVTGRNLDKFLGVRRYDFGVAEKENQIGQVVGLAWTEVGGDLLTIESMTMPGKGNTIRTGTLGDVMKESIEAARTVVRSRARVLGIPNDVFDKTDIHIHVPEGATPKDGPSAGTAITTAIYSMLNNKKIKYNIAITGEICLNGNVTEIGGLDLKILGAIKAGVKEILFPLDNMKDYNNFMEKYKDKPLLDGIKFHPVNKIQEVFDLVFEE